MRPDAGLRLDEWLLPDRCVTIIHHYAELLFCAIRLLKRFDSSLPVCFGAVLDSKAIDSNQPMNALMRLNQIRPGLQYKLLSQSGPVHAPVFTMSVDVDGTVYEASGSSKKTAKLHVAVKVSSHLSTSLSDGLKCTFIIIFIKPCTLSLSFPISGASVNLHIKQRAIKRPRNGCCYQTCWLEFARNFQQSLELIQNNAGT